MEFRGLTDGEVRDRISKGEVNSVENAVSRTYFDIVTKNVFTFFNLLIFTVTALLLYFKEVTSAAAAVGIIVMNILIATIQEIRAKRRLDKIALLMRPKVAVLRNGEEKEIDQSKIVKDDMIHLRSGDQALVDGVLLSVRSLEIDESLLTGESNTVRKMENDTIYSGSYCITGEGYYQVTAFGNRTYAAKMLASAKKFDNKQSPLQMETGAITKLLMIFALTYLAVLILVNLYFGNKLTDVGNLKLYVVILDIVPIGLFLMIVIAYMIAAVRMSNSGVLLQRANSVESMSHVDTVCMDKTGTITTNKLVFKELTAFTDTEKAEHYLCLFASATGSPNKTIEAILNKYGKADVILIDEILFSSERKFSAVRVADEGKEISLILGAYNVLTGKIKDNNGLKDAVDAYSAQGLRSVILAATDDGGLFGSAETELPSLDLIAVVAISDEVRPDCKETLDLFIAGGLEIRILSGDDPAAVDALFRLAGLPGERKILSGDEMERLSGSEKRERILETNIFGRMKPDQKELVIEELKKSGRYVAMVGDGVNDVKSLKEAQVGIALQSGSGAARGVADMVLVSDNFSALPKALKEGNRTVSGMRDILKLYLVRNFVIAMMILLTVLIFSAPPLVPITNTIYAFLGLSIASFFMVIWAKPSKIEGSILPEVLRYTIPTALLVSLFGIILYGIFYTDIVHDLLGIVLTPTELNEFAWQGRNSGITGTANEIVARNALLLFLIMASLLQILFVVPRFKFFSVDGKIYKDVKPTILMILLICLIGLIYWVIWEYGAVYHDLVVEFTIFMLPISAYAIVIAFLALWFFVTRWVLRNGFLERFTHFTEWLYSLQLKSIRKKRDRSTERRKDQ